MSWDAIKWARVQGLTGPKQSILVVLSTRTGDEHTCRPSLTRLAKETGFSRSTVIRCLNELETAGLLVKERRFNTSNVYRFQLSAGIQPDADPAQAQARHAVTPTGEPVPKTVLQDTHGEPLTPEIGGLLTPENGGQTETVIVSVCDPPSVTVTPPSSRVTPPPVSECDPKETDVNTKNIHGKHIPPDHAAKAARSKRNRPIPDDFTISADVQAWAAENGFTHLEDHLEAVILWAKMKGPRCEDWNEILKRAIRDNWGLVSNEPPKGKAIDMEEYARRSREEGIRELERIEAEYHARRIARLGGLQASAL